MKIIYFALILAVSLFLAGCGYDSNYGKSSGSSTPTTVTGESASISISNFSFDPSSIIISSGTTVTWTNNDSAAHNVTKTAGPVSFSSNNMSQNDKYSFKFTNVGTYEYKCDFHTSMTGKVTVK